MSRRASLLAKQEKRKPRVRFPDALVFLDNIKGNDIQACHSMLRRASVQLDINGLDSSGVTPLHNAVLEGNLAAVRLLLQHGADINRQDSDTWTPLHAACANGEADIARYLLHKGASKDIKTSDGERALDLCDARDFAVISVMLESETSRKARLLNAQDEDLESGIHNDDIYEDDEYQDRSSGHVSVTDLVDSSPEVQRKTAQIQNDIKNANANSKSQTSNSMTSLSISSGQSSPSRLSPKTVPRNPSPLTIKSKSPASLQHHSTASFRPHDSEISKPAKQVGQSILKKSPQQFRTVKE